MSNTVSKSRQTRAYRGLNLGWGLVLLCVTAAWAQDAQCLLESVDETASCSSSSASPSSSPSASSSSCCGDTAASMLNPGGGPDESTPGLNECTAPTGVLEPSNGLGAVSYQFELASYTSMQFPDPACYPQTTQSGGWFFTPPSLTHNPGGEGSPGTYMGQFSASKARYFDPAATLPCAGASMGYVGRNDNRFSKLVRSAGFATIHDRSGRKWVFSDPYTTGPTPVTRLVSQIVDVGGSRWEYEYTNPSSQLKYIWFYNAEIAKYTRVIVYNPWDEYDPATAAGNYVPDGAEEYIAIADVTSPTFVEAQWKKKKTTTFRFHLDGGCPLPGAEGLLRDLAALDELTYLSNHTEAVPVTSLKRNAFRYFIFGTGAVPEICKSQLKAVIGPDTFQHWLSSVHGATAQSFLATPLSGLGTYIDVQFGYFPPADAQKKYRLQARNIISSAGSCGCFGTAGGTFFYDYTMHTPINKNDWAVQVKVDKLAGIVPVPYATYIYTSYGKKLSEIMHDPANPTQVQVKKWEYDNDTGQLLRKFAPSACTGSASEGAVYHFAYDASQQYLTAERYSKGSSGPLTTLYELTYTPVPDPVDACRSKYFLTERIDFLPAVDLQNFVAESTTYARTFHAADALAVAKVTTTLPAVKNSGPDQNGSGASGIAYEYYDKLGRRAWYKDAAGAVFATTYHPYHGSVVTTIADVNTTTLMPPHTDLNQTYVRSSSWPNGAFPSHLTTTYTYDQTGRLIQKVDPHFRSRRYLYTKLAKGEDVLLEFPHLSSASYAIAPLKISVSYQGGRVVDKADAELSTSVTSSNYTNAWNPTLATMSDALGANGILESRMSYLTDFGHVTKVRRYINPAVTEPMASDYYETNFAYDSHGNVSRMQDPSDPVTAAVGTVMSYEYDFLGRLLSTKIGTNDQAGSSNMVEVERRLYDGKAESDATPSLLDGNLTTLIQRIDGTGTNDRKTEYLYDYTNEGRLYETRWSWLTGSSYKICKRLSFVARHVTEEKLIVNPGAAESLRGWTKYFYDSRGQVYESHTVAVDPNTGSSNPSTDFLKTRTWRNQRGDVVKVLENGGALHKTQFDGLGRVQRSTISWQASAEDYVASTDPALGGDTVVSQSETLYDAGGNPIILKRLDRQPAYTGTGLLAHAASSQASGDYTVIWNDVEDRETHNLYYGDNNNFNMTSRPTPIPSGSDSNQLQTKREYYRTGELSSVIDPQGIRTEFVYDKLGRLIEKKENTADPSVWGNRRTEYSYTPTDQLRTISAATAINNSGVTTPQVTTYFYGVNPSQNPGGAGYTSITSNRLLQRIEYPQDDGQAENEYFGYNRQGDPTFRQDIAGIQHRHDYNVDGTLRADVVLNAGSVAANFDTTVQSLWRTHDDIGRLKKVVSRADMNAPPAGAPPTVGSLNAVEYFYDKYGLVIETRQNHSSDDTIQPLAYKRVLKTFNYPVSGGLPGLRLASTTYPNNLVINENYTAGTADYYLSRVTGRAQSGGTTLFQNSYLGLNRVLKKNHPGPQIDWDVTLDRFKRTATLKVKYLPYSYLHNNYEYGYNFNSQVVFRKELTTSGQSEQATYNGLSMLSSFKRGVHDAQGNIANPPWAQYWTPQPPPPSFPLTETIDHSGNWRQYTIATGSALTYTQTFNKSNELISIEPTGISLSYDSNGNTRAYGSTVYKYDLWNRLVLVTSNGGAVVAFEYNGLHQKIVKDAVPGNPGDQSKLYFYNDDYQVVQEYSWDGVNKGLSSPLYSYVHGTQYIDELVARRTENIPTPTWQYYMQDANFNVVTLINSSGSLINRYTYTPYGVPKQLSGAWFLSGAIVEDLRLFTGQSYVVSTGIYDYRTRCLDSATGKFLSRDVAGEWYEPGGYGNGYGYAAFDPVGRVDPFGLSTELSSLRSQNVWSLIQPEIKKCICAAAKAVVEAAAMGQTLTPADALTACLMDRINVSGILKPIKSVLSSDDAVKAATKAQAAARAAGKSADEIAEAGKKGKAAAVRDTIADKPEFIDAEKKIAAEAKKCDPKLGASGSSAARGGARAVDPNKLNHIFGQARHNLDDVVKAAGSREGAFDALQKGAQSAVDAGKLTGGFETVVNVGGFDVTVRGAVVDGVARIGTAFR